jgi:hypothetical protein
MDFACFSVQSLRLVFPSQSLPILAYEVGLSSATPLMLSFDENPICNVCKAKFAMFRRPLNCRNCGVCICSGCTTTWPSKMLPSTYLNKRDKSTVSGELC